MGQPYFDHHGNVVRFAAGLWVFPRIGDLTCAMEDVQVFIEPGTYTIGSSLRCEALWHDKYDGYYCPVEQGNKTLGYTWQYDLLGYMELGEDDNCGPAQGSPDLTDVAEEPPRFELDQQLRIVAPEGQKGIYVVADLRYDDEAMDDYLDEDGYTGWWYELQRVDGPGGRREVGEHELVEYDIEVVE